MKYVLIIYSQNNTEDKFKFKSRIDLYEFILELMSEKLEDRNFVEMRYDIIVGD